MKLLLEIKIENIFKANDFTDEKTGQHKIGKWKIQGFDNVETENGMKMKLVDVSVPDEVAFKLKEQIGKVVTIPVGTYVNNGRAGFYGL
ncbi:MAG: hypothetical protein QG630_535 [Patescibacteria group bacterium]|nr:hypothetical protein [Patescibacteria group bacterium]MDQ1433153.1 hypothetical protein [Patescibacteria group bacterium]